jgi:multiple sugar transport system permease protein
LTVASTRRTAPRKTVQTVIYHAVMLMISCVFLLPFYWMTISAFKNNAEIFARPVMWFPDPIRWSNFVELFSRDDFPFLIQFGNSVFYAGSVALAVCFSCSLAAYSFGCLRWRWRDRVFGLTVCALLLPAIVTFLPVYLGWSRLGLNGTYWPLITPFLFGDAFFIFMLRNSGYGGR